jgi:exonuclease SbcD
MKLLHTSDWHLGRTLCSKKERTNEHAAFLEWLLTTIKAKSIDILVVAGDIFDSSTPSNAAQKMYYDFLLNVRNSGCKNVIIIGGNHDSPSFLNAPKEILAHLNVTVVGNATENIENEIFVLKDENQNPIAIICAVPFLRERDISRFTESESYADRSKRIAENIRKHYENVAEIAKQKRENICKNIPIIATGHLSVVGGKRAEDDGVRDTYIGTIEVIDSNIFSKSFDYVALGHFHIASIIGGKNNIRYCGSPIPMGFSEAKQQKMVVIVDFKQDIITEIPVPCFFKLESICGDKTMIENRLSELRKNNESIWVEIIYEGNDIFPDFTAWANERTVDTKIEILKLQNRQYLTEVLTQADHDLSLDELDNFEVFDKLLEKNSISEEQKEKLKESYIEIVAELNIEN